ncbi:uncharacterized protein LOC131054724 isoform X3 [Cryptomeria japonica]|uniref:uncharacterized protein LOC131054724 isoform X3 n=1 Tax=Cryptomeria japonica TaxID=3369 RepID=UPI0025ABFDF5|nr:uncharacterized protein LOC131054724 isoform X3 [Cryptomeria japonica]
MERSKKRSRGFTAEEMEVADALLMLCHLDCFLVRWAVKRRRSAIARDGLSDTRPTHQSKLANRSPLTALGLSWSESDEFDERAGGPPPSSNETSVKNVCRRRLPKKKTHKELKEMVNTLSSEKSTLKKEEEQLMKTYHELQEQNHHLKSQLAACLNQRREQKLLSTPQPTSSSSDKGSIPDYLGLLFVVFASVKRSPKTLGLYLVRGPHQKQMLKNARYGYAANVLLEFHCNLLLARLMRRVSWLLSHPEAFYPPLKMEMSADRHEYVTVKLELVTQSSRSILSRTAAEEEDIIR